MQVPTLSLSAEKIDFGTCFLRHPYIQPVELVNPSGLPAKFEVVFTEDNNPYADSLTCEIASGSIGPRSRLPLNLRMVARHLGPVALTIFVRTVGSEAQPMSIQYAFFHVRMDGLRNASNLLFLFAFAEEHV